MCHQNGECLADNSGGRGHAWVEEKINTLIRNLGVKEMELLNHKIMKGVKLILFGCFIINK